MRNYWVKYQWYRALKVVIDLQVAIDTYQAQLSTVMIARKTIIVRWDPPLSLPF